MHKKKFSALVVAGLLTVCVIGGTLAWFTSQDSVTNIFNTATTDKNDPDAGVDIEEDFDKDSAGEVLPGDKVTKKVQVSNTSSYEQFIRVKITPKFVTNDENRREITSVELGGKTYNLDTNLIELNFTDHLNESKDAGTWFKGNDGYYYYMGKVAGGSFTNTLLESVTLSSQAGNEYKNIGFDVVVEADSIQASNDAYADWCHDSLDSVYSNFQGIEAVSPSDKKITSDNK